MNETRDGNEAVPAYRSLAVIRAELDQRMSEQERRHAAFDARASLVIAFGGALIGLGNGSPNLVQLLGFASAGLAAALAGIALWPTSARTISIRSLREDFLRTDEAVTRLMLLDTLIALQEIDEERLQSKILWTRRAVVPLALSIVLALAGAIVEDVHGRDGHAGPTWEQVGGTTWTRTT